MQPTVSSLLVATQRRLAPSSLSPRLDAELLLAHLLGWPRARLLAEGAYLIAPSQVAALEQLVERRTTGEPVAYLIGHKEFYGLDFAVDRRVLVPRPDTELLVELAIAQAFRIGIAKSVSLPPYPSPHHRITVSPPPLIIADIGTGSGAVAVALAANLPSAVLYAVDLSADAIAVAQTNVVRHNLVGRITLLHGDLLSPLPCPVDLLVSNPPYTVLAEVAPNVRAHEPRLALEGGPDGAAIYRRLLAQAPAVLRPGGALLLEIGAWQAELVVDLARSAFPQAMVTVATDLAGHDRVVTILP